VNKKGIELGINFIVMLILAVVVFSFGLIFVRQLFSEAEGIKEQLDRDTEQQIEQLLDRGQRVAFPISSRDVNAGQSAIFGLGILNVLDQETTFEINLECTTGVDRRDNTVPCGVEKITFDIDPITLEKNAKEVIPIVVRPPSGASKGDTYIFTVTVYNGNDIYGGSPKQIYVNIE